jgi:arginine-tRNA-protein transferase
MTAPRVGLPLAFYATPPHPCSYLPGRSAVTVFADPAGHKDRAIYTAVSHHGFRRSGAYIYRPDCPQCEACVPVRVPVREFAPRRSQRRVLRANQDLRVVARAPELHPEHFDLYRRYLQARHPGGGMDNPTPAQYLEFLASSWSDTVFYEFSTASQVAAVAVVDRLDDGLSAVYTFFDPALATRSLGVYAILWEIDEARRLDLEWLYLGYWVKESPKMHYKVEYQPMEYFRRGVWRRDPRAPASE